MNRLLSGSLYGINLLISLGLALAIGYAASSLVWQLSHKRPLSIQSVPLINTTLASNQVSYDWQVLLKQDWFGVKNRPSIPAQTGNTAPSNRNNAPETRLKLDLKGTLFSDNPKLATAIIAGPDGKAKVYRPEKTLPSGVVLDSVLPNEVVLRRQQGYEQHYETLKMKSTDGSKIDSNLRPAEPPLQLSEIRSQVLQNPSELATWLRLRPVKNQGQFQGYMISAGRDKRLLEQLGLEKDDIVTRVNGVPLTGNIESLQALQKLQDASAITLDLVRKGTPLSRTFEF